MHLSSLVSANKRLLPMVVCGVVVLLSFTGSVHAQSPATPDSTGIKGLADTPDHPLLQQKKGRTTGDKILRFPATAVEFIFEGIVYLVGKPLSVFVQPAMTSEVKAFGGWLGRKHLYMGDGNQGDGSGFGVEISLKGQTGQTRPLTVTLSSAMTIRTYQAHALRIRQVLSRQLTLDVWGQYRSRPRENFYGIGPTSILADQSRYKLSNVNTGLALSYDFTRVGVTWMADWTDYRINDGSGNALPSTLDVFPGLTGSGGAKLLGVGVGVHFPLVLYQRPGWDTGIDASVRTYLDTGGSVFGFNRYMVSLYQAAPIFWDDRVLAIRVTGMAVDQHGRKTVPFFMAPHLGGTGDLRGYDTLRFRDRKAFWVNAEYRYPFWDIGIPEGTPEGRPVGWAADIVLFMDTGMVFDSFKQDFKYRNLSTDYGGGIRLRTKDGVTARAIIAHGSEATRFIVKIGGDF